MNKTDSNLLPYACDYCRYRSKFKHDLKRHMNRKHKEMLNKNGGKGRQGTQSIQLENTINVACQQPSETSSIFPSPSRKKRIILTADGGSSSVDACDAGMNTAGHHQSTGDTIYYDIRFIKNFKMLIVGK